jgi:hypothetical protein
VALEPCSGIKLHGIHFVISSAVRGRVCALAGGWDRSCRPNSSAFVINVFRAHSRPTWVYTRRLKFFGAQMSNIYSQPISESQTVKPGRYLRSAPRDNPCLWLDFGKRWWRRAMRLPNAPVCFAATLLDLASEAQAVVAFFWRPESPKLFWSGNLGAKLARSYDHSALALERRTIRIYGRSTACRPPNGSMG